MEKSVVDALANDASPAKLALSDMYKFVVVAFPAMSEDEYIFVEVELVVVELVTVRPVSVVAPKLTLPPVREPVTVRSPFTVVVAREVAPLEERVVAETALPEITVFFIVPPDQRELLKSLSCNSSIRRAPATPL